MNKHIEKAETRERWDLLDRNRQPLGKTMFRGDPITAGAYHLCVEIWTVNSAGEILLTLRHPEKPDYPNLWECTSGSVLAGESSHAGAVREIWEETGILAREEELLKLDSCLVKNMVFFDIYIIRRDLPLAQIRLQEGETVDAQWVSAAKLDEMIAQGLIVDIIAERLQKVRADFDRFRLQKLQ